MGITTFLPTDFGYLELSVIHVVVIVLIVAAIISVIIMNQARMLGSRRRPE